MNPLKFAILFCCLSTALFAGAQEGDSKIIPQYNYDQIDSLVTATITSLKKTEGAIVIVAYTKWYIGSVSSGHKKYAPHDNHFEIYFLYEKPKKCVFHKTYMAAVDNFGFFRKRRIMSSETYAFLHYNFGKMEQEYLTPKVDTIYGANGEKLYSSTIVDHELEYEIYISSFAATLQYNYRASYSENKDNLLKYRYKLLDVMERAEAVYDKKKRKRIGVKWGKLTNTD